ncbi:MAG: 4Fe-4S dicluster domain-containing protein [Minwuiales bacterium]|nr:4Fe-4S dicluster domain-containing protein [Minwuiales bacterium]
MKRRWTGEAWQAPEEWRDVLPDISGNEVNGLGEREPRRPTQIFWHRRLADQPFARAQVAVTERFNSVPALDEVYRTAERGPRKLPDPADTRVEDTAESWTSRIKAFVLGDPDARPDEYPLDDCAAEMVGIAEMDPLWVYEGYDCDLPHVIMIGTVMDHARLMQLPGDDQQVEGQLEVADQYNRGARVANWLAHWVRAQGYRARPHAGPWVGSLNLVPAALAAGFGELGCHGSIIHPVHGSALRLAAVETDLPLVPDGSRRFGANEFCLRCQVCSNACPPQAIKKDKEWVRGVKKFYVDFDVCLPYFNETYSCGICVAVCPWSTPGKAPKLAEIWARRIPDETTED